MAETFSIVIMSITDEQFENCEGENHSFCAANKKGFNITLIYI